MHPRLLTESEFRPTFSQPMRDVTETATDDVDIWPYVDAIPAEDLEGHSVLDVELVYRAGDGHFDHALIKTDARNVYLVLVVDLVKDSIHGHRLLDLNAEYGLRLSPGPK